MLSRECLPHLFSDTRIFFHPLVCYVDLEKGHACVENKNEMQIIRCYLMVRLLTEGITYVSQLDACTHVLAL